MSKRIRYFIISGLLVLGIVACESTEGDDDTVAPKISDVVITSREVTPGGDSLYLSYKFTDDQYLSTYSVKIDSTRSFTVTDTTFAIFNLLYVGSFDPRKGEKNSAVRKNSFAIPEFLTKNKLRKSIAPGKYLLTISCLDRAGNFAEQIIDTLIINPAKEEETL